MPVGRGELQERFGKLPDGLVLTRTKHRTGLGAPIYLADWVEVESARKDIDQLQAMFRLMAEATWLNVAETLHLERLVLMFNRGSGHEKAIERALRGFLQAQFGSVEAAPEILLASIVLVRRKLGRPRNGRATRRSPAGISCGARRRRNSRPAVRPVYQNRSIGPAPDASRRRQCELGVPRASSKSKAQAVPR